MKTIYSFNNAKKLGFALLVFMALVFGAKHAEAYCTATATAACGSDEYINKVVFGDISNSSGCTAGGYTNFTSMSTLAYTNSKYDITVTNANPFATDYCYVWIDYNHNDTFDSGEQVILANDANKTFTATITIPSTALTGNTTMRVRLTYSTAPSACGSVSFGETEDYTVNIQEKPMEYKSCTNTQVTTSLKPGTLGNVIIGSQVVTDGTASPYSVTNFSCNTTGTTNTADITVAKLYYSGLTNSAAGATLLGTVNNPSGNFSFTVNQTLSGGTNYFWIVYDIASSATIGNKVDAECTSITVAGTARTPSTTAPTGNRTIKAAMTGTYTVGTGGNFTLLSDAFAELTAIGIKGNVTLNLVSDIAEPTNATLGVVAEEGGSGYKINIIASAPRQITGNVASNGVLSLVDADNITIDGTNGGSNRYITIKNNYNTGTAYGIQLSNGASKNTIKGVNVLGHGAAQLFYGIYILGNNNDNLTIESNQISSNYLYAGNIDIYSTGVNANVSIKNNIIKFCTIGIRIDGATTNLEISGNQIGDNAATETIVVWGILTTNTLTTANISNNRIFNMQLTQGYTTNNIIGIYIAGGNTGLSITGNRIHNIKRTITSGAYGAHGIDIEAGTNVLIANNMIAEINSFGGTATAVDQTNIFGIRIAGGTGHKIYHNSISMTETFVDQVSTHMSANLMISSAAVTGLDIRNNIFRNEMASSISGTKAYSIYLTSVPSTINNNNYYVAGTRGVLGYFNADLTAMSDIKAKTGQDATSISVAPQFFASDDLHLSGTSTGNSNFLTTPITGLTTDKDGETRRTSNVQMGADEVRPIFNFVPNLTQFSGVKCAFLNYSFTFTPVISFGDGVNRTITTNLPTYTWYKDGNLMPGKSGTSLDVNYALAADRGTYQAKAVFITETGQTTTSFLDIEEPINIQTQPASMDVCMSSGTSLLTVGATGTINNYQWQKLNTSTNNWENISGANASAYTVDLASLPVYSSNPLLNRASFRVLLSSPGNCGAALVTSGTSVITVSTPLTNNTLTMNTPDGTICLNDQTTMTSNATGTIYGYQWQKWNGAIYTNLNSIDFPTAQAKTLIIPKSVLTHTGDYRVLVLGGASCGQSNSPSPAKHLEVLTSALFAGQPEKKVEICEGESFSHGVTVEGTILAYHWQKDGKDLDTKLFKTADKAYFLVNTSTFENSGIYRCRVTVEDCHGENDIYSDESVVQVNPKTEITRQPENAVVEIGGTAMFYFDTQVQGVKNPQDVVIQWYKNGAMLMDDMKAGGKVAGARSNLLTISKIDTNDLKNVYFAKVMGLCGVDSTSKVIIKENVTLAITSSPMNMSVCEDETVNLNVMANVSNTKYMINYQWYKDNTVINDDARISGSMTNKLTIMNATETDQAAYSCRVWVDGVDDLKTGKAVLALNAKLSVLEKSAEMMNAETGKELMLFVKMGTNTTTTYQWQLNGIDIAGATTATYTVANTTMADAGSYTVHVINACGTMDVDVSDVTVTQGAISGIEFDDNSAFTMWNTPNPFADETKITVRLDKSADVRIVISDITGRELSTIYNATHEAGQFEVTFNAEKLHLNSGVYNYTLIANDSRITRQMIIVK